MGCFALNKLMPRNTFVSENLRETPGVVLIDEIDVHLHPKWQRRVVEDLRTTFPKIQFVSTTHSPFVVQSMREEELRNLNGQAIPELGNTGVEAISRGLMTYCFLTATTPAMPTTTGKMVPSRLASFSRRTKRLWRRRPCGLLA